MSKQPPPAPTASAISPCPNITQIVGCPGTGSFPRTIAPPPTLLLISGDGIFMDCESDLFIQDTICVK